MLELATGVSAAFLAAVATTPTVVWSQILKIQILVHVAIQGGVARKATDIKKQPGNKPTGNARGTQAPRRKRPLELRAPLTQHYRAYFR